MHGVNMNGFELTEQKINQLVELALRARERAYVPYSHFRVGACLMSKNGTLYCGCNIENAGYTPTNCAERTAVFKAVSEGCRKLSAIAIVGGLKDGECDYTYPCGICRQVIAEFAEQGCVIVVAKNKQEYRMYSVEELLPETFHLNKEE